MWKKPESATQQEKTQSEFWQPSKDQRGEVVVGMLTEIKATSYGRALILAPVILYPFRKDAEPQPFGSIAVGLNSWLDKLVKDSHINTAIAIAFQGMVGTPAGNMRTFNLYELSVEDWAEALKSHGKGVDMRSFMATPDDIEPQDELPF